MQNDHNYCLHVLIERTHRYMMILRRAQEYLGFENGFVLILYSFIFGDSSFRPLRIKTHSFFILNNKYMCLDLHLSIQPG